MLRFSYYRSEGADEWILFGQLAGPWVDELRSVWRRIRLHSSSGRALVNIKEVTSIDKSGEKLLAEMRSDGAHLVGAAFESRIESLKDGRS